MKKWRTKLFLLVIPLSISNAFATLSVIVQSDLNEVTLYSRSGHQKQNLGESAYNFSAKLRSDSPSWPRGHAHLYYGSLSVDHDSDWFSVDGLSLSRIKDLGEMRWSDVVATPFIPVLPHSSEGIRGPGRGESWESSSEGRVTRVVAGHMYVMHIKNSEEDFYVMLRIDALKPSDNCTMSWKIMPSPESAAVSEEVPQPSK